MPDTAGPETQRPGQAAPGGGFRGLTTRGRCLLAGGLAAIVCAIVLDERDLLRVGIFAALLPIVGMLVGMSRRVRLAAEHLVTPLRLDTGTRGMVSLSLTNNGSVRSSTLEIAEPPTSDLTSGVRCLLPPLRPGQRGRTDYPLHAERRGKFLLGPPNVRIADPFGLWEETRTLPIRTEVLVVPHVVPLAGMPVSTGSRSAAADRAVAGATGGDPDVGVRPYRSGDDIRTIHWRASARYDDLMVRLDEPVSHGEATVMLDHRAGAHRGAGVGSSLETAVTLAASVSEHLLAADHQIRLTTHDGSVLCRGRDITDDVLAQLAVVEPDRTSTMAPGAIAGSGLIVAILGDLDPGSARTLVAARRRNTNAVAFVLHAAEWARPQGPATSTAVSGTSSRGTTTNGGTGNGTTTTTKGTGVAITAGVALLRTAGWRVVDMHAGDDLAVAWGRACSGSAAFQRAGERAAPLPAAAGVAR